VLERTGVRDDAAGGDGAVAQCPEEFRVPGLALAFIGFNIGQSAGDTLIGVVDRLIDDLARLALETVLFIPRYPERRLAREVLAAFLAMTWRCAVSIVVSFSRRYFMMKCVLRGLALDLVVYAGQIRGIFRACQALVYIH